MSSLMKFQSGAVVLQFIAGGDYPAKRKHSLTQVSDRTASGKLQTEDLGLYFKTRVLNFNLMPLEDYQALITWFLDVAVGSKNEFEFTDEYGDVGTVRILDSELDFDETSYQRFSGSITLEYTL